MNESRPTPQDLNDERTTPRPPTCSPGAGRVLRLFGEHSPPCADGIIPSDDDHLASALPRFRSVEAVVFDMGDVLFDATSWRRSLLALLRRLGLQAGYRSLFNLWDRDYLDAVHRRERDYAEAFTAFLRDAGLSPGQVDEINAASQQIKRRCEAEVRPFPGVRETLERLRVLGLKLAVLSDSESPATAIAARLQKLGIGEMFGAVVSSADLRRTKPHPLCYLTAAERLGAAATATAFVGHDAEELSGARRCGMRTIAFNYDRDASADCRLAHFTDLVRLFDAPADGEHAADRRAA